MRTLIRDDFTRAFEKVDTIVCPMSPEVAFKVGDRRRNSSVEGAPL